MNRSEAINELATALYKAQSNIQTAKKANENPHFRSKYADLASVWDACRTALTNQGLSVLQSPRMIFTESGAGVVELETMLIHSSGQWMSDTLSVPLSKLDAQGVGSAITYARRYALAAFVSVAPDDDDGNAAVSGGPLNGRPKTVQKAPVGYDTWADSLRAAADNGLKPLEEVFKAGTVDQRKHLGEYGIRALKEKAAAADAAGAQ